MGQQFETIRVERQDGVAIITLAQPERGNAVDLTMARELMQAAIACDHDASARAVLLRSEGRMFCAGGNINSFVEAGDHLPEMIAEVAGMFHVAVARLMRMDKPLVTAVQGFAAGAGFSLAIMGDIVIAGESAQFTPAYTAIGLSPDGGATWLLPRLIGLRRAQQMMFENTRLKAAEALDAGLVTQVVADAELEAAALACAVRLAAGPTRAYARIRELLLASYGQSLETQLEGEARFIAGNGAAHDGKEGVAAFQAKRSPNFTGKP